DAGKSQLVASITNASPAVAEYPFTTQTATPGMIEFENIQIQLIDTPPLAPPSIEWWLRHMLIRADALLIVVKGYSATAGEALVILATSWDLPALGAT
ncbi:unnamed protein product, partial [marine sediment metagenome]